MNEPAVLVTGAAAAPPAGATTVEDVMRQPSRGSRPAHGGRRAPRELPLFAGDSLLPVMETAVRTRLRLALDPDEVTSPTFTLVHEYRGGRLPLIHVDLYRLDSADLDDIGLDPDLAREGVVAVEWAERLTRSIAAARHIRLADAGVWVPDHPPAAPAGPPEQFRFTADQISTELTQAGFALQTSHDFLPRQLFLVYGVK